jgi:zinc protease
LDYFTDYFPAMNNVTKQDIQNYVKKYITGKPYVAGMIINAEMNKQYNPAEYFKN